MFKHCPRPPSSNILSKQMPDVWIKVSKRATHQERIAKKNSDDRDFQQLMNQSVFSINAIDLLKRRTRLESTDWKPPKLLAVNCNDVSRQVDAVVEHWLLLIDVIFSSTSNDDMQQPL